MNATVIADSLASGFLLGGLLALTALGLSIVLGVMRLVNLAHGEFLVAGAYLAFFLSERTGIDPIVALPLIGGIVALLAFPVQWFLIAPLAGKGPEAPMMTTFGISLILQNVFLLAFTADSRAIDLPYAAASFSIGFLTVPQIYLMGFAVSLVTIALVHLLVSHTRFGRELRASAADPIAAAVNGVDVRRVYALTFALGGACAGVGGAMIGAALSFTPSTGGTYLLTGFAIVVLGGLGNVFGTLVAGIALGVLQSAGGLVFGDGYRDLVGLVVFLLALTFRPQGILAAPIRR
jgi:branched-chain amino acid transport system permease protein